MTKTPDEIVVGANGSIYVAPVGSTKPATINVPLGGEFVELGYATEDGVTWTDGKTLESIRAWQSFYDLRRIVSAKEGMIAFALMQWNGVTVPLAFGGGEITESAPGSGLFEYVPPDPSVIDERMLVVEWADGDKDYRLGFSKGIVSENVETNVVRTAEARLPITFALLGEEGVDPFFLQTNDPAFENGIGS